MTFHCRFHHGHRCCLQSSIFPSKPRSILTTRKKFSSSSIHTLTSLMLRQCHLLCLHPIQSASYIRLIIQKQHSFIIFSGKILLLSVMLSHSLSGYLQGVSYFIRVFSGELVILGYVCLITYPIIFSCPSIIAFIKLFCNYLFNHLSSLPYAKLSEDMDYVNHYLF